MRQILIILLVLTANLNAVEIQTKGSQMANSVKSANEMLEIADTLFKKSDWDSANKGYQATLKFALSEFNRSVEVEALSQLARIRLKMNQKEEGRKFLKQAGDKASDSDPMGYSRYLGVRGRYEWLDNDLVSARKTFDEMYIYCNTNGLWSRTVDAAHMVAIVAESPEEQIEWGRRGIEAAEAGDVEEWLGPLWNNLAGTYYDQKQFDSALECYIKAREYHWKYSGEIAKLYADYHVGMASRLAGHPEEAKKWLRPVLAWAERLGNHSAIGQTCEDLGEIEISKGNKAKGLSLLKRARDEYKLEGFDKSWKEVWDGINARIKLVESN